jgi:hypothetical protein
LSDADDQHSFGKLMTKAFQQYLYLLQSMIVTAVITLLLFVELYRFSANYSIFDFLACLLSDADDQHSFGKLLTKAFQQYLSLLQSMIVTAVITLSVYCLLNCTARFIE